METRRRLGLDRTAFGQALGIASAASAYAQVRKWEAGIVEPSDGTKTAMRLLLELEECRRLPWMTPELWQAAQFAHDELNAMFAHAHKLAERRVFVSAGQVLRTLLERKPT